MLSKFERMVVECNWGNKQCSFQIYKKNPSLPWKEPIGYLPANGDIKILTAWY